MAAYVADPRHDVLWRAGLSRGTKEKVAEQLGDAAGAALDKVRLSVWKWRAGAITLYERLGFTVADAGEERGRLVCAECAVWVAAVTR